MYVSVQPDDDGLQARKQAVTRQAMSVLGGEVKGSFSCSTRGGVQTIFLCQRFPVSLLTMRDRHSTVGAGLPLSLLYVRKAVFRSAPM